MTTSKRPVTWRQSKLKDVCYDITVGHVGSMAREYVESGIPFLRSQNVEPFRLNRDDVKFISKEFHAKLKKSALKPGDVAVVRTGYPGTACVIPDDLPVSNCADLVVIRPSEHINSRYLVAIFNSTWGKGAVAGNLVGVAQQHFNIGAARELVIDLPHITTQNKIAGILSAYDDLMENNTRRIAILEATAQAIYREWFVEFRFPGHEKVKLVDSPQGQIPEGWRWSKLKDICDSVNYGYTASANKEVEVGPKFLRITDIVPSTIDWQNVPFCEVDDGDAAKYALHEGDIVIARTGATTGYAKRINKRHPKSVFASYLVRICPTSALGRHYIGVIVESNEYKMFIKRNLGGAAQPQANAQVLTSLDVLVPQTKVIKSFDMLLEPLVDQKEILQVKNRNLRKTRDLLLPKLISGQLDVEDLDIDAGERLVEAVA